MNYLNFDKSNLTNLEKSLTKEMIRTNRSGAYNSTTLVGCNTRKYHGQLVVPIPSIDADNHVLLSSLDETIVQHGAAFNLAVHQYKDGTISPNGHKYIREFMCELIPKTVYRVGGVIISKERIMISKDKRIVLKYTLLEAHSATTIRFKPFLAFRNVHELSKENQMADQNFTPAKNGVSYCMYTHYPHLYVQFSKKAIYVHEPHWNKDLFYYKEQERGYESTEDLLVPGYFELPIKKGETLYVTAGLDEIAPRKIAQLWKEELEGRNARSDMFNCLKNAAAQFRHQTDQGCFLLPGYPWFHTRARDEFISLPGCTLSVGEGEVFDRIAGTAIQEIKNFINGTPSTKLEELDAPDALLWFIWALQQSYLERDPEYFTKEYAEIVLEIIQFISKQQHPYLFKHDDGLLYVDGSHTPMTWMNATENKQAITPRSGCVVEINALWYNALCFAISICKFPPQKFQMEQLVEKLNRSFVDTFWNGIYLYDYVNGLEQNVEVRPNMILAVALPHTPLTRQQQKSILDICTRELLTSKGLRSLSPKSGYYRPNYVGSMSDRCWNYHNGPVWPWLTSFYAEAYWKIHGQSGHSFLERMTIGMEAEMKKLCIGTLSELYDGNPPFKGHGAMSYAPSVAAILRLLELLKKTENL